MFYAVCTVISKTKSSALHSAILRNEFWFQGGYTVFFLLFYYTPAKLKSVCWGRSVLVHVCLHDILTEICYDHVNDRNAPWTRGTTFDGTWQGNGWYRVLDSTTWRTTRHIDIVVVSLHTVLTKLKTFWYNIFSRKQWNYTTERAKKTEKITT